MSIAFRGSFTAILLAWSISAPAGVADIPSGAYGLDKTHGYITFSYSHLGFSNPHVGFDDFDVRLELDGETPEDSVIEVSIDAASIDSRVAEFDEHLNSPDLFDTARYPTISFESTRIEHAGDNKYRVTGDLTIKGITKSVTLDTTINKAAIHPMLDVPTIGISATTRVMRSAFDLGYAVPAVSDEVTISIEVELIQDTD
jgi:polyisoprenoid-binding protein YceI